MIESVHVPGMRRSVPGDSLVPYCDTSLDFLIFLAFQIRNLMMSAWGGRTEQSDALVMTVTL